MGGGGGGGGVEAFQNHGNLLVKSVLLLCLDVLRVCVVCEVEALSA